MNKNQIIGIWLKEKRKKANIRQSEVNERFKKSPTWISDIERGYNRVILEDAIGLCELYDCSLNELYQILHKEK